MRSIAFYLPQYHPTPENDEWWGAGFTEWSNVAKATSRFPGHYQPHLPADLGFYDLRLPETRAAQATLAKAHGVDGFCYYHYWFNGRRMLERPFNEVLESGEPDFPFMLCWANENWTRTWDAGEQHLLLAQHYSLEDDRRHIQSLLPAFHDPRYIKIDGRPVFLIYRIESLPDPRATTELWRREARHAGFPDLYLCRVEGGSTPRDDPRPYGVDAAVEFVPDFRRATPVRRSFAHRVLRRAFRPDSGARWNNIHEYDAVVERALADPETPYVRFRGVMPSWDNSPRRERWAQIYVGGTPEKYGAWLEQTIQRFSPPSAEEDLIFTNAWNEWAEGCHLEPDQRWGHGYLDAHARAMARPTGKPAFEVTPSLHSGRPLSRSTEQARRTS